MAPYPSVIGCRDTFLACQIDVNCPSTCSLFGHLCITFFASCNTYDKCLISNSQIAPWSPSLSLLWSPIRGSNLLHCVHFTYCQPFQRLSGFDVACNAQRPYHHGLRDRQRRPLSNIVFGHPDWGGKRPWRRAPPLHHLDPSAPALERESGHGGAPPSRTNYFFCWRLLGYVPGGAPFSQLNKGVKDAMAISTKWCYTSSKHWQKHATRPQRFKQTIRKISVVRSHKHNVYKKRALVKSQRKAPTPEWEKVRVDTRVRIEGFGEIPKESTYARAGSTQLWREGKRKNGWI